MSKHLLVITFTVIGLSVWSYLSGATGAPGPAAAQQASAQTHTGHKTVTPETLEWRPVQPGTEVAVLSGNPAQEGSPFTLRLKLRDQTKVPPHWHPNDEHLTVISGVFHLGTGEKFDRAAAQRLPVGSYLMMPKEMRHFAWVEGETVVQLHGVGPFKTIWVNPADDPSQKAGSATN
jgi:hypothetical protein